MERSDARLIDYIQQATRGGCMLLRTLGVRGKALQGRDPERAGWLLAAVRTHPLYKGGRLAFDMLELEDLMLDAPSAPLLDDAQLGELLSAVAANSRDLIHATLRFASDERDGTGAAASGGQSREQAVNAGAGSARPEATLLPRVSFGPASNLVQPTPSTADANGGNGAEAEPQLLPSDYLYDYVVLGFLDMLGRQIG
ncbi:MAG TPA: hypothetical protein VHM64_04965, partial [Candidatus Binatia bacterium]|nr:hypothetical protein [Candidatus Binatia bacterium]